MRKAILALKLSAALSSISLAAGMIALRAGWSPGWSTAFHHPTASRLAPGTLQAESEVIYEVPGGKFGPIRVDNNPLGLMAGMCTGTPPTLIFARGDNKEPAVKIEHASADAPAARPVTGIAKFDLASALGVQPHPDSGPGK